MIERTIVLETVPGEPKRRRVFVEHPCKMFDGSTKMIPTTFITDGSSTPFGFKWLIARHDHPIDSTEHDFGCAEAENDEERKWYDYKFSKGIKNTKAPTKKACAWLKVQSVAGCIGVRIGAFFGIGNNF